ncbi:5-(carboxyamino)imidazole ribonucleotide synthase [Anaerobranca californiensis DSM 14826]|jgi:5-(carboxyamino)imidazole ribonucleotide synthase|uniref:N5-carboxyaminoimidazole ribonucleotide synthase n=1 Tax=Anaerobranca californiensis DSM 14826 TaxID=1120989 RepID=A0A1M6PW79_9FIRM|nr:5-(carboxyamino)imidazole ribonucleotide synthase [Anaerobranca californiensis]SHK12254.1 5-(carboxyamino)imidazole ribonucleotide synthase [Anaerobranca californiensis DSM 14826]
MDLMDGILPGATIGILGGGQLGRMMALAARQMGYKIAVLEKEKNSPCGQIADYEVIGDYQDLEKAEELARISDVVTYEFENISLETAKVIERIGKLPQGSQLLGISQHRGREKRAIESLAIKVAPYHLINDLQDLQRAVSKLGLPAILKTCRGGYDGKGQWVLKGQGDFLKVVEELDFNQQYILEKMIPFTKELSIIVNRNSKGHVTSFPISENIHLNGILHITIAPARIDKVIEEQVKAIGITLARGLNLVGTLAVEMFLTEEGEIFVNELAPRPHNSGHYTIEGCEISQFAQHIRATTNLPLGSTKLLKPSVMINILGEDLENVLSSIAKLADAHLHLYGKEESKKGRKMGHITFLGDTVEEALTKAKGSGFIKAEV